MLFLRGYKTPLKQKSSLYCLFFIPSFAFFLNKEEPCKLTLAPEADSVTQFIRGGEKLNYHVYDLKNQTSGRRSFNLNGFYSSPVTHRDVTPPPLYAHRYVTGEELLLPFV